ncbi:glycoside hydrolase family 31 protein [Xanthocytophaga flava]|uniref:glycoside hydrolase family 31 protein n=1 Tax=Xanthocytophaga flava TaxID=3048013 RepID=UPI0028D4A4D5|nr:TIM-barrel domain-containing protein [Xanthocytophaga flavus]MDJ1470421.1 glycoside hydrolase family 31 protein [Xanthocytophaga flavus]
MEKPVKRNRFRFIAGVFALMSSPLVNAQTPFILNDPVDISKDFKEYTNTYFLADNLKTFDPASLSGSITWKRARYTTRHAFDNTMSGLDLAPQNEFPGIEYAADPVLPFSIQFVSPKTIRIRATSGPQYHKSEPSLMLVKEPATDKSWQYAKVAGGHQYKSAFGRIVIKENPWKIEVWDAQGRLLTQTRHQTDGKSSFTPTLPFSFVRRASDYSRSIAAVFSLMPDEKIYGCGESFTKLNKYGQKVVLWADDVNGVETNEIYKPVPFFMSSRGYGMFMHTSSPITCDFGATFNANNALMIGDDELDLFVFLGEPKDILDEYTNLTGKAAMPPLWSFGLWMSRITYFSEEDGRKVAKQLRENKIPSDVIHFDTGWFETDWRCDYQFAPSRFKDPVGMIQDLKKQGFHTCLWQLPYFVPKNKLFTEIVDKGLAVKDGKGNIPYEDAVLDFTNPSTIQWYQDKIGGLLKQGVSAIKVDFGEAAPLNGVYSNGRTGFYEHNLYPLRYQTAVADITKRINNENIIWARSSWAGSQRFPLHWGGDAESTDMGMESELRGGLSLGLSGFSFWSHDAGGFTTKTPEELYRRWLLMGLFSSHTRCHGQAPKEPWEYGKNFNDYFRKATEMRYKLMPYIYAQAKQATEKGLPVLRALFVEFPNDPGAWQVDNEYLFGSEMLVAPLFESGLRSRNVYLPQGQWIDYQTGKVYAGGWHTIEAGELDIILLVRDGAMLPHIKLAQSTAEMDWTNLDLVVYSANGNTAKGIVCLPTDNVVKTVNLTKKGNAFAVDKDPLNGRVKWKVKYYTELSVK